MVMPGGLRGPKEGEEGSSIYSSGRMVGCVIGKGVNICLDQLRPLGGPNFMLSCVVRTLCWGLELFSSLLKSSVARKHRAFVSTLVARKHQTSTSMSVCCGNYQSTQDGWLVGWFSSNAMFGWGFIKETSLRRYVWFIGRSCKGALMISDTRSSCPVS